MSLVVELRSSDAGLNEWLFEYPDGYEARSHTGGVWINVIDENKDSVALHKAEEVLSVYRTKPKKTVPVDTRLNYQLLRRDSKGRFVAKTG